MLPGYSWTASERVRRPNGNWIMANLIHQHSTLVQGRDGKRYRARSFGEARTDGTWSGWLEFVPMDGSMPVLRTDQETSQPDRSAVDYWAGGLERVYLEGALERALSKVSVPSH
jgi:hypothetical protein